MTYEEWSNQRGGIPLYQFLRAIDCTTVRVAIYVWVDADCEPGRTQKSFYLTKDAFAGTGYTELKRLLEYYANVPVWNAHAILVDDWDQTVIRQVYRPCITANCHYRDVRDALAREKEDIRREKRHQWRAEQKRNGREA